MGSLARLGWDKRLLGWAYRLGYSDGLGSWDTWFGSGAWLLGWDQGLGWLNKGSLTLCNNGD